MKNYREKYVELCKEFIEELFADICKIGGGIETECFWECAEKSGLWERGTFATPMSEALWEMCIVDDVHNVNGEYMYTVLRLK